MSPENGGSTCTMQLNEHATVERLVMDTLKDMHSITSDTQIHNLYYLNKNKLYLKGMPIKSCLFHTVHIEHFHFTTRSL